LTPPCLSELNRYFYATGIGHDFDFAINSDLALASNGIVTSVKIGTDDGVDIFLQYSDLAAASETASNGVPKGGSGLGLLGLSVVGLVGLSRLRPRQLA
jgi:hypothetical protein